MLPGHFLVNTGQLLERWANDRIPATPHRVRNFSGELRHSAAFLVAPRKDVMIETLPTCIDAEHPDKYPPITYGEHLAAIRAQNYDIPDKDQNAA